MKTKEEFKAMVVEMLDIYRWQGDEILRKAMEEERFLSAFKKRCESDEDYYNVNFFDAVYYRIPRELCKLEYNNIKTR